MEDKQFIENIVERLEENRKTIEKIDESARTEGSMGSRYLPAMAIDMSCSDIYPRPDCNECYVLGLQHALVLYDG